MQPLNCTVIQMCFLQKDPEVSGSLGQFSVDLENSVQGIQQHEGQLLKMHYQEAKKGLSCYKKIS